MGAGETCRVNQFPRRVESNPCPEVFFNLERKPWFQVSFLSSQAENIEGQMRKSVSDGSGHRSPGSWF